MLRVALPAALLMGLLLLAPSAAADTRVAAYCDRNEEDLPRCGVLMGTPNGACTPVGVVGICRDTSSQFLVGVAVYGAGNPCQHGDDCYGVHTVSQLCRERLGGGIGVEQPGGDIKVPYDTGIGLEKLYDCE